MPYVLIFFWITLFQKSVLGQYIYSKRNSVLEEIVKKVKKGVLLQRQERIQSVLGKENQVHTNGGMSLVRHHLDKAGAEL